MSGVREATHAPHPHAEDEDGAAVGATVEAGAGAGAIAGQDPYLDLLGEVIVTLRDQGALATAGAPCNLPPHQQRSAAARLMEAGVQGAPAPGVR